MWVSVLLVALGGQPCLPDELDRVSLGDEPSVAPPASPAVPAPAPTPATPTAPPAPAPEAAAPAHASVRAPTGRPAESSRYRVVYSVLGQLGEVEISFSAPGPEVRGVGVGKGSLFGLGQLEKRVETTLDPRAAGARRWVTSRIGSGKHIVDTIEQSAPGAIAAIRQRTGRPDEPSSFKRGRPVLDPLGFLWHLRTRPPTGPEVYEVLDGRALWVITVGPERPVPAARGHRTLVLAGRAEPVFWDGSADPERTARRFAIHLADDDYRTPLRLLMPLPVGEVRVELVSVDRPVARAD